MNMKAAARSLQLITFSMMVEITFSHKMKFPKELSRVQWANAGPYDYFDSDLYEYLKQPYSDPDDDIFERKRESLQNLSKPIGFFSCHRCSEEFSAASGLTEHFAKCKMFSGPYYVNEDEIINVD